MKELRVTFASDRFNAVSQVLIDMGISFSVEPVDDAPPELVAAHAAPAPATRRRKTAKATAKTAVAAKRRAARTTADAPAPGAHRLREAIARRQTTFQSPFEPNEPAADTSGVSPPSHAGDPGDR